jgi:hypothetical protein
MVQVRVQQFFKELNMNQQFPREMETHSEWKVKAMQRCNC